LGECFRPQAHPISVGEWKEMSPKHSQVTSIMKVIVARVFQIFGTKVNAINLVQIGLSTYHEKGFKVQMLKMGSQFSFQVMR